MTQFEIPTANIVFAEFMGERRRNLELDENKSGYHYDTDYDWLMPVLVKIEALGFHWEMGTSATEPYHYCRIVGIGTTEGVSTIDAIYGACYHFIKLYNNKPKS